MTSSSNRRALKSYSKIIGLYQTFLRRNLEHFFPELHVETLGGRTVIDWSSRPGQSNYRIEEEPDGLGIILHWFKTPYRLTPGRPVPFLASERRLVHSIARSLDARFRSIYSSHTNDSRLEMFHYANEDYVVADHLNPSDPLRICIALEALRVATLSTYENRRVSTGTLLLGTPNDPAQPDRTKSEGAPHYNVRLSAVKSFHRLCDGVRTVFLVDRDGDLNWVTDIRTWTDRVQGQEPLAIPCARDYVDHARATRTGGHVCLILTPNQEIKLFANGEPMFAFSDARWRLIDLPSKFEVWSQAVGPAHPPDLARRLFQAALNLSEARDGALFVVLRNPSESLTQMVDPADLIQNHANCELAASGSYTDPEIGSGHLSPRIAKQALHHLVRDQGIGDLDETVLEALAGIDGAVVCDTCGHLLTFGAILKISPEATLGNRAIEGARTTAAIAASFHGPVLKVSEDGLLTMFLNGRRIWDL